MEEDQSEAVFPLRVPSPQCRASPQVEGLRHPKQRNDALSRLKPADPELTSAVGNVLSLLDDDIGLRNRHTHSQ
jgi:hypothetical protein